MYLTGPRAARRVRGLDHHAEKRSRNHLDQLFVVQRNAVTRFLQVHQRPNMRPACVRMLVQQFADRRARLSGFPIRLSRRLVSTRSATRYRPIISKPRRGPSKAASSAGRPASTFAMMHSRSGSITRKRSISQEIVEAVQSRRQMALDRRAGEQPISMPMADPSSND